MATRKLSASSIATGSKGISISDSIDPYFKYVTQLLNFNGNII